MIEELEQRQLEKIEAEKKPISLDSINGIELSEFKRRSIGVQIFSEVLNENVWFCSDKKIADQIQKDDPGAVCYRADELSKLIDLDPSKEFLNKVHNAKSVFKNSTLIQKKSKNEEVKNYE